MLFSLVCPGKDRIRDTDMEVNFKLLELEGIEAPVNNPNGEGIERVEENNISRACGDPTVDAGGSGFSASNLYLGLCSFW
ncbi:hypothetical protein J1N35_017989 [Gossypium stocksii]|uniref:Uncharacterized protein n=1 Tax=Gossypium stocksii TaxID=47602 RepID=A0A9D3VP36_9ROSI|nr:hypothetical protein J1N35_017989 [Gossypium stocksii]